MASRQYLHPSWLPRYRPASDSAKASFLSWMFIHNETINIYTHLVPAIAFLLGKCYILVYLYSHYPGITGVDYSVFSVYFLTAAVCLGLSTTYHTMMNHSHRLIAKWLRMDFLDIVFLTIGMFVSGISMTLWCEPLERGIYWGMVSHVFSLEFMH